MHAHIPVQQIDEHVIHLVTEILNVNFLEFVPYTFQILAVILVGYSDGAQPHDIFSSQFNQFLDGEFWQPAGNVPALALLIRAYCIRLPALLLGAFDQIAGICEVLLGGGRSHPHGFSIFISILQHAPLELSLPYLPHIFTIAIRPLINEDESVTRYDSAFAGFMSISASLIGPDNLLSSIPAELLRHSIGAWARGLRYISGRIELENAMDGALKMLTQGSVASEDLWFALFKGLMMMMERVGFHERFELDLQAMREEDEQAKQFDTSFSKLRYAEFPGDVLHPELRGENLIQLVAVTLANFSQSRPGILPPAIAGLDPSLRSVFQRYETNYHIQYA
jgi:exportin-2 (importin alpha re-exporter)